MPMLLSWAGKFFSALLFLVLPLFSLFPQEYIEDDEFEIAFDDETGITIVGTQQTSQQMAVINREDIEQRGAQDIASLLQETLNLNIARYGPYGNQTSIHIRGYSSRRIAFLIDGVPANSAMDGGFDINQIDLNAIERIEVVYGGSDTKFNTSGAQGGVINIITVKRQNPGWRFHGSISNTSSMPGEYRDRDGKKQNPHYADLFDAQNIAVSAAYGGDGFSFRAGVFANRAANNFTYTDLFNHIRRKENNEVWDTGANGTGIWELSGFTRLIASTNFYYGDKNIPTSGYAGIFGNQTDFFSRQTFMFDMPRAGHDDLATEASLSWHFARMDYTSSADAFSRHDQNNLSAINRWTWYTCEKLTLKSGFDYRFIRLDSSETGDLNRHDGGIYLTAEFQPIKPFQVIPSVKAVFTSRGTENVTAVPKLGLLWNVTDSIAIKNNYFRSFKYPEFEDLYWSGGYGYGNPDLRPEDGWGGDIGVEWNLNNLLTLESVFFTQWLKDSIHWFSGRGGVWRPENVGEALFLGLENRLGFEIPVSIGPVRQISPSLTYTYLRSYLLSFGYTFDSDMRIPYNPEHTIGGSLDICWGSGSLLISGHYESVRYHDRANLIELMPYFLLNAAVNQKITGSLTAFGSLQNILNTSYESFYAYPMPGITLTIGMRINIEAGGHETQR
ncbi:MAG: TonB-dependent receptor [Treponema sp.]|nr:TonB-dependent receptor [Treponema sp.]